MTLGLQRLRLWWENASWVIPLAGIVGAAALSQAIVQLDQDVADPERGLLSASSAQTLLSAIGGGMVTFTGFVFSVVLLVIQFGSSAYSPRTVTYFMRARSTQWVLACFLGTVTFSFLTLFSIGSGRQESFVPFFGTATAVLLLVLSLVGFLVLISSVSTRIKVDALHTSIGAMARRRLRRRHAAATGRGARPEEPDDDLAIEGGVVVRYAGRPGQLVAVSVGHLGRLVRRDGVHVRVLVRVGDGVSVGSPIALVAAADARPSDRELSRCLLVRHERSLAHDPLYALRLLTDVALKALSPGINDPTTAVRSLDEVEGVLRVAAALPLGAAVIDAGRGSVQLRGATWADVVDLALLEVVEAGISQPQVTRRLSALLADLIADLPVALHAPLVRHTRRLTDEVRAAHPRDHELWLTGDRQGLGGSR
ncbi:DUF2254 domain-containing protein [Terrabacter aeriphilus]|uniref:DUF2254 domain-containing protein n=1 Tax=Terrabacter aeriphilus TaxID=515662 RepID=A0ABP9JKI7_9MICO